MSDTTLGLALLLVAGIMNASFTLPMKFTRSWSWENTWLAWSIFALILLPPVVTALTVPRLGDVYRDAGLGPSVLAATFGVGWGVDRHRAYLLYRFGNFRGGWQSASAASLAFEPAFHGRRWRDYRRGSLSDRRSEHLRGSGAAARGGSERRGGTRQCFHGERIDTFDFVRAGSIVRKFWA